MTHSPGPNQLDPTRLLSLVSAIATIADEQGASLAEIETAAMYVLARGADLHGFARAQRVRDVLMRLYLAAPYNGAELES